MATISYTLPVAGSTLNAVADPEIDTALSTLLAFCNGGIDAANLSALLAQAAGVNQAGQAVRGAVSIAASESRTNVAYGTMPTPDQVPGIVVPASAIVKVRYQATWQESVAGAARAAIFIGANQQKIAYDTPGSPATIAAATNGATANINRPLATSPSGLVGVISGGGAYGGDVTTGQAIGVADVAGIVQEINGSVIATAQAGAGACEIFNLPAATYTFAVQFKASSGSVTASNRHLYVSVEAFV